MDDLYIWLLWFEIIACPITLISLLIISAPYGKHSRAGWGISLNSKAAWVIMEFPALITILAVYFSLSSPQNNLAIILIGLWQIHYGYRTIIYPALMKGSKKSFPITVLLLAILFNIINGFLNGYEIATTVYAISWFGSKSFIMGTLLFLIGFLLHSTSDTIIRNLRKKGGPGYSIPFGGMFSYVSNPNYLGEIIQWIGWAILTGTYAGWAFAAFTFANLFPRAIANHKWYKTNFTNYPKNRRILIPFVY